MELLQSLLILALCFTQSVQASYGTTRNAQEAKNKKRKANEVTNTITTSSVTYSINPCFCSSCNITSMATMAGDHSCGSRISWLKSERGLPELQACKVVAQDEHPTECGSCNPLTCQLQPICAVQTCTLDVLSMVACNNNLGGCHTCADRIRHLVEANGLATVDACEKVAFEQFPNECGKCSSVLSSRLATPTALPIAPSPMPIVPSPMPSAPSPNPIAPSPMPVAPTASPIAPSAMPIAPTASPIAPSAGPIAPSSRLVIQAPTARPVVRRAPTRRPVVRAPTRRPVVRTPTRRPVVRTPSARPIAPSARPTSPTESPVPPSTSPVPPTAAPVVAQTTSPPFTIDIGRDNETPDNACRVATCTQAVLDSMACNDSLGGCFTCGSRINYLINTMMYQASDACKTIGFDQFLGVCGGCMPDELRSPVPAVDPNKLIWSDEFNYEGAPDPAKWTYDIGTGNWGWGNNELQYYTDHLDNAFVKDGLLHIRARKQSVGGMAYTSARIKTINRADWKYGRIQIRTRLSGGAARGTWAALWMLPTDNVYGIWPNSGEIDIMEHVGYDAGTIHGTVHTAAYNHMLSTQRGGRMTTDLSQWHVYEIEWTENKIDFIIDGSRYFVFTRKTTDTSREWPFDQNFHLIFNIAVGGSWGGLRGIDDGAFEGEGQTMEVDWVRVYAP